MSTPRPAQESGRSALAIVCGAGSLPFALADAALRRGQRVVLFGLRGFADPKRIAAYPHHWMWIGQFGRFLRLAAQQGCGEVAFIGAVIRPSLLSMRPDLMALKHLPDIIRMFRGGDNHLHGVLSQAFEQYGMLLVATKDIAPELLMPAGTLGSGSPAERDLADIERGLALLRTASPFDIGQAAVVANNRVLALEGPEGTDQMLARIGELRRSGRIRSRTGVGVLVKAPKVGQDHRIDLPVIGPETVDRTAAAGLAGIAVVAGSTIVAEPERVAEAANRTKLFVIGVANDGSAR